MAAGTKIGRLEGLDLARFIAFVGMVIVNFSIVMGAEGTGGVLGAIIYGLEGRAAATFVVLAGIGLGLAGLKGEINLTIFTTFKRAAFLLVLGLLNMLIFDADILHYYAFYFLFGALLLPLSNRALGWVIAGLATTAVLMVLTLDYEAGWNWTDLAYPEFWTPVGFVRNLFFNGWHPVIPWLAFLLYGVMLSRWSLSSARTQDALMLGGLMAFLLVNAVSAYLQPLLAMVDPELVDLVTTNPIPPMPFYLIAGMSVASMVVGVCLRAAPLLKSIGVLAVLNPAGRQTLTLYLAHILLGMGVMDELGLLGGQTTQTAFLASGIFCALAVIYALIWSRFFKRGPIEALMRKVAG
ncbi:putative Membrane Spanning Protein [Pseudovibrio sp. FO-BEG1]|uniref:DUF418 domain-containing protein n=1 Tax=Pseudovibrio sp. (strain FO-BEG1) TaxID=911045 RepID=UPI000238D66F|nr:DUF418 domain-containing protein [Pseudovibrio sp. FO-BEG1]AEV35853.1 putative Membrane Spanning Protein [Pseudovibrio sp. FO-BEG1]